LFAIFEASSYQSIRFLGKSCAIPHDAAINAYLNSANNPNKRVMANESWPVDRTAYRTAEAARHSSQHSLRQMQS
jgi:hypothetical protein